MEIEIWKGVFDYEGLYQVSNWGRVKSFQWKKNWEIRATPKDDKGYCHIALSKNDKTKPCKVHRLVAMTFIPNPENKYSVNHIDGDKENNHVSNLEWATRKEQYQHAKETGLNTQHAKHSRKVFQISLDGQIVATHESTRAAARTINGTPAGIQAVCNGTRKTCRGFVWEYCD